MRAARLPFEPRQFEFWFAYKSGRNAALNAAANEIKGRNGALTGPDIDRLHEIYLSPWRMAEKPDAVAARMSAQARGARRHARKRDRHGAGAARDVRGGEQASSPSPRR